MFTHTQAQIIDISAFPHSVISAKQGIAKAKEENPQLNEPLIMVSVNIGRDPHFRRIELDTNKCTECLACIPTCPSDAFYQESESFNYNIDLCFGCSNCLPACHFDALNFKDWSAFNPESLYELQLLGAKAIEIHLSPDLDAFSSFYQSLDSKFELESFCIGSDLPEGMTIEELLIASTHRIIGEVEAKHGKDHPFIIQTDGIPISGARDLGIDKDLTTINNARIVLDIINKHYPNRDNIFVQLAGGTNEDSLAKAHKLGVNVHGVAIGSYARKQLDQIKDKIEAIKTAKKMVKTGTSILQN